MAKDCWELVESVLGKSRRVLLYGPPGTGKTYSAVKTNTPKAYSKSAEEEIDNIYQITMTEDTASANLEGFYKPSSTGTFEWHDGIAIQSWKNGGRLIINEIDHASPDAMTFLHAILDDQEIAMLTLNNDNNDTIHPKAMEGFDAKWHGVITDTSLIEDDEERISIRTWAEFFRLQKESGFTESEAGELVFADKAEEIIDAVKLANAK